MDLKSACGDEPWLGFPTIDEIIACYRAGTHRDTAHLRWYGVLAC